MSRAKVVSDDQGRFYGIRFNCPGCALARNHDPTSSIAGATILPVKWLPVGQTESPHLAAMASRWGFNGDLDRPTLTPSVFCQWDQWQGEDKPKKHHVCHSFVSDGRIQFLDDCTHALAGQTIDLPEIVE